MAQPPARVSSTDQLKAASSDVAQAFLALRREVEASGPLERKYRELINVGAFTVARNESSVKTHGGRALDAGASPDELRQAALLALAATTGIAAVADALRWIDDLLVTRAS